MRDWLRRLVRPRHLSAKRLTGLERARVGLAHVLFETEKMDSPALFAFRRSADRLVVRLNAAHAAFPLLENALRLSASGATDVVRKDDELIASRLECAQASLQLILAAWAQYEYELTDGRLRRAEESRYDWGRVTRRMMSA